MNKCDLYRRYFNERLATSDVTETEFETFASTDPVTLEPQKMNYAVFVSYSQRDKAFVQRLCDAFKVHQQTIWVDWEDIPPNADWRQEIFEGIVAANTFLFVLSPDSVASYECGVEIDHALKQNKRLMPILWRDVDPKAVHPALSALNWIYFQDNDNFDHAFQSLLTAINTDLEHVRFHTRLLQRSLEWDTKAREESFLLRGKDLEEVEQWLASGADKQPQPTHLQQEYAITSRLAETAEFETRTQSLDDELRAALAIVDEHEQTATLAHLMARSPEAPSNLLHSLSTIENEEDRISVLIALIPHLSGSLLPQALAIVRYIKNLKG